MTFRRLICALCVPFFLFAGELDAQKRKATQPSSKTRAVVKSKTEKAAQKNSQEVEPTKLDAFKEFKRQNPNARFYGSQFYQSTDPNDEAGGMTSVYGTILSVGTSPEDSAMNHLNDIRGMLGKEIGNLVPEIKEDGSVTQGVMYNQATGKYKFQILRYNQAVNDIPVFRSGIGFLVRERRGYPLVMSGITVKDLTGATIASPAGAPKATTAMLSNVSSLFGTNPVMRSVLKQKAPTKPVVPTEEEYVIFAGVDGKFAAPELAVQFVAEQGTLKDYPEYHKSLIVASVATGEILHEETMVCYCSTCLVDVQGTVSGRATEGLATLECDPEVARALPYAEVEIVGGNSTTTDASGQFTIANGGSSDVQVTSHLRGTYFEVFDESAGGSTPSLTQTVTPGNAATFLHNPTNNDDLMTANVNCYVEANVIRDYVLSYAPNFPVIANQTGFDINTNIASSCNAFYNGSSINFYQAGGGCNNTAAADVIYHEYGHHLINVTGNGQGQMGEGSGDSIGVLLEDDPILGQGFQQNCNAGIRNANNNLQYPCSGGIHFCGQLMSGCVWSLRNELIQTEPSNYRDIGASLFINMLIVRGQMDPGQTTIAPDITVIYLELDDDDEDIGNGTPHYDEIAAAFGSHNMDAPPLNVLSFDFPNGLPEIVPHTGGVVGLVQVNGQSGTPQPNTGVLYVDTGDGNGFQSYPMNQVSENLYEANFPPAACASTVQYYFSAEATSSFVQFNPASAPADSYTALVGTTAEDTFVEDFESVSGWTVSGDATDGQWDLGTPVGGGDRGDPADDADGSGQCYLTDNVDGNSDVDGGSTVLTSGIFDATEADNAVAILSYQRWYSNNFGNAPEADVFVVEISNDGGSNWVNLETVGPAGAEVRGGWIKATHRISDFVAPTNQMRLRFTCSDLGDGSVVEAGVDDLRVTQVVCENPVPIQGRKRLTGNTTGGTFEDLLESDDLIYQMEPAETSNPFKQRIDMIVLTESPTTSPSQFSVRVEGAMAGGPVGDVMMAIELYDQTTKSWVEIDSRAASDSYEVVTVSPVADPSNYVDSDTGEVLARVILTSLDFSNNGDVPFDWTYGFDQIILLIE